MKAPGTKRLKLGHDELLSSVAFKINLRRYNVAYEWVLKHNSHHSFWEQMLVGNGQAVIVGVFILIWREGWTTGVTLLTPENLFTGFTGIAAMAVVLQATSGLIAAGLLRQGGAVSHRITSAWLQRVKLQYDCVRSDFASSFHLRSYAEVRG